nr:hypothetical protein [Tanacetum cinerariifolium]
MHILTNYYNLLNNGKENRINILKSIDEGSYQIGTVRETLAESTEGAPQFGPERSRVYSDLTSEEKDWYNVDIQATNILLQGQTKDIYTLIGHYTDAKDIWDNVKMLLEGSELTKEDRESQLFMMVVKLNKGLRDSNYDQLYAYLKQHETHAKENKMMLEHFSQPTNVQGQPNRGKGMNPWGGSAAGYGGAQNRVGNVNPGQARPVKCYNYNGIIKQSCFGHRTVVVSCRLTTGAQNRVGNVNPGQARPGQARPVKCYNYNASSSTQVPPPLVDSSSPAEDLIENDLALNVDNVFQADDCNAFDSDVDEAPTTQTMFMVNLSSADPVTNKAEPSYDSDILSEVPDYEHYQDAACAHHKGHVTHDSIQLDHVVDSHADYTSDSNMIPYDQYVKDNEVPVVHSDASSVPTDAFMMIYNAMCESHDQSVSNPSWNTVVKTL